ncbi:phage holin family protein [Phycicoccus sp. MAQZ13P-2]|uniref:phage holin family protein n=1 Tax=Phycicoccus TaxID=367298 RepID=UPI00068A9EA4|nr:MULTISPECIES: phage holin family protein [Phycicoccus]MBT9257442.1 phage holin family protein [Phycicoccus mangrovi]MBT9275683.1 phage holin family protein [Phycicoccus mangrovi]
MTERSTRPDLPEPSLRSVGEILGEVTSDLSTLVRQEVDLAKAELRQSADHAKAGASMLAVTAVAGHLVLVFLSVAAWWGLGQWMGRDWSALVVALVWALVAAVTAVLGRNRLRRATPVAPRTVDTTTEIPDALRGQS